jgi:hypothetical protein
MEFEIEAVDPREPRREFFLERTCFLLRLSRKSIRRVAGLASVMGKLPGEL